VLSLRRYLAAVAAVTGALAPPWSASAERAHPTATMVRINGVRFDIVSLSVAGRRDAMAQELARAWRAEGPATPHVLQFGETLVVGRQRGSLHETVSITPTAVPRRLEVRVAVQNLSVLPGPVATLPFRMPSGLRVRNVVEHASGAVTFTLDDARAVGALGSILLHAATRDGWRMSGRAVRGDGRVGLPGGGLAWWGVRGRQRLDGVALPQGAGTRVLLLVSQAMPDGAAHVR
jgi:hypothetical protein